MVWFALLVSGRCQVTPITLAVASGHMALQGGRPRQPQPPGTAGFDTFCKDSYRTMHFGSFLYQLSPASLYPSPHQIQECGDLTVELSQIFRAFGRNKALTLGHCQDHLLWD